MTCRAIVLAIALFAITLMGADRLSAQIRQDPNSPGDGLLTVRPLVLAGPDVGFRVVRMDGSIPVGQVVVKINGIWVTAEISK